MSDAHTMSVTEERVSSFHYSPHITASFVIQGKELPADHGYLLYSAISRSIESLHGADWLGVELISGFPAGQGLIRLSEHDANLRLRIPAERYREVMPLAGKPLDIGGYRIRLGLPTARALEPAPSLYARVVTIKKFTEPEAFLEAVNRKLNQFGIKGRTELPRDEQGRYRRRIVTIHGKAVVGFSVAVHELSDEDSLMLQAGAVKVISPEDTSVKWQNIFSRRSMGCGIFNPIVADLETIT